MPLEIESLSPEAQKALPLWVQRVIAWANVECVITDYGSSDTEIDPYAATIAEMKKPKENWAEKTGIILSGAWLLSAVLKIVPSPEWHPLQPYDGLFFFGWIACVWMGGALYFYGDWKSRQSKNRPESTYGDESW